MPANLTEKIELYLKESFATTSYDEMRKKLKVGYSTLFKWTNQLGLKRERLYTSNGYESDDQSLADILLIVSCVTGVSEDEIKSKSRKWMHVLSRQIFFYLAYHYSKNGVEGIGFYMGGRDHTTVLHNLQSIKDVVETDYKNSRELLIKSERSVSEICKRYKKRGSSKMIVLKPAAQ